LLHRRDNSLITKSWQEFTVISPDQQRRSALNAVWVCANDWRRNQSEPFAQLKSLLWNRRTLKANIPLAIAELRNYLAQGRSLPPSPGKDAIKILRPKDDHSGRILGTPLLAQLYLFCQSDKFKEQRRPYRNLWDVPFALAGHFYMASLELDGSAQVENDEEREAQAEIDQLQRQAEEEAAKSAGSDLKPNAPVPDVQIPANHPGTGLATPPPDLT
jgi:hypothetical protein